MKQENIRPQVGVSACLLGKKVRYDGGHISCDFVRDECSEAFDFHPVCPEVEIGLGIPRPTIQLRRIDNNIELVYSKKTDEKLTAKMSAYSENKVTQMPSLDGFIFKKGSPSCGVFRVPVVDDRTGMRKSDGVGIFAKAFKERFPYVPTEDEGRLNDKKIRENFLERVYAHSRWRKVYSEKNNLNEFRDFHKRYKLILMAKNQVAYRELGRLVASAKCENLTEIKSEYYRLFMTVMEKIPTNGHHINVMMHILGYLKQKISSDEKAELLEWFEIYRAGKVSRVTPLALLQHHFNNHEDRYISQQHYFKPFPDEIAFPI